MWKTQRSSFRVIPGATSTSCSCVGRLNLPACLGASLRRKRYAGCAIVLPEVKILAYSITAEF